MLALRCSLWCSNTRCTKSNV